MEHSLGSVYVTIYKNPIFCVGKSGFLILNDFKMLARFSKCDFWIPGQILDFKNFVSKKNIEKFKILKKWEIFVILRISKGFPLRKPLGNP